MFENIDKSNWQTHRFDEIAYSISEKIDPTNTDLEIYVGLEHLDPESLHIKRFGEQGDVMGLKLRCYPGDIIFGKRRAYQRKAAIVEFDGFCSAHALVLRANSEIIEPELFPFFLQSDLFMHRAVDISVGSLSPTINWKTLKQQEFLLPPKDQQAKIAELLWAMDDVVVNEKEVLEKLRLTYLSQIEIVLLKKDGLKKRVSDLGNIIRGVGYKPSDLLDQYSDGSCIILRANNIKESDINYDDIKILEMKTVKYFQILKQNDFAICMSNGSKELVGKTAKYNDDLKNVSVGSFCAAFRPNGVKETSIVQHFFASESYRQNIKRVLTGSNINNLKPIDIESIKFRINVSDSIINKTLDKLDKMKDSTIRIKKSIETSKQLQNSLINEIFTV
jgi:restriction endonuclease S subunit